MTQLAKRLKELRIVSGYNQDYVASFLQVARQTYGHYETGKRIPKPETIYKLAGLYDVPVENIMHMSIELDKNIYYDSPAPTESSKELSEYLDYYSNPDIRQKYRHNTDIEKELLFYFNKASLDDKKELVEIAKIKARKNTKNKE